MRPRTGSRSLSARLHLLRRCHCQCIFVDALQHFATPPLMHLALCLQLHKVCCYACFVLILPECRNFNVQIAKYPFLLCISAIPNLQNQICTCFPRPDASLPYRTFVFHPQGQANWSGRTELPDPTSPRDAVSLSSG